MSYFLLQCVVHEGTVSFSTGGGCRIFYFSCDLKSEVTVFGLCEGRKWWEKDDGSIMPKSNLRESRSLQSASDNSSTTESNVKNGTPSTMRPARLWTDSRLSDCCLVIIIIIIIIRYLYSAIMPLGGYRGAGRA